MMRLVGWRDVQRIGDDKKSRGSRRESPHHYMKVMSREAAEVARGNTRRRKNRRAWRMNRRDRWKMTRG
jgi:hypothetical protein